MKSIPPSPAMGPGVCILEGHMVIPQRKQWHPTEYSCLENPMDGGAW